jgi:glycosyltransferase involved in cell wall biosynthesis
LSSLPAQLTVLHVTQPVEGGVGRYVASLVQAQLRHGWRPVVACPAEGWLAAQLAAAGVEHLPWGAHREVGRSLLREIVELRDHVSAVNPAAVHLHSSKAGLVGRLVVRGRRPTLFQPHAWSFAAVDGPMRRAVTGWERIASRWVHLLICVSADERRLGRSAGIRSPAATVLYGIDLERFAVAEPAERELARKELLAADAREAPVAVCVGRLCRQKGQDLLFRAWPAVLAEVPDAHLVLVGDGPDRARLEASSPPHVRIVGEQEDIPRWLAVADVVALPSRWEGMAFTLLEAMACGRSVVATDATGMRQALEGQEGTAGAVVPIEDPAALARALTDRLRDPGAAAAEGALGRQHVMRHHDQARQLHAVICHTAGLVGALA